GDAHYGGRMAQLPDASLIITLGDGFDYREQAQVLGNHLGSVVRIGTDGVAPEDNPFIDSPDARPEVFSYGHRNVQGLVYDPVEQLLISHEHGPRGGDEINVLRPGQNYGWPVITYGLDYTGARITPFTEYPNMEQPLLQWTPSIAPSGMTRYRGELFPEWRGDLFVGALADRSVRRVEFVDGEAEDVETLFKELKARIRDVITGPDGALYLLTDESDGRVLRVSPKP
ncbi:PQQ-dependent sugar dehydrogenase, partial [Marinobacter alexandrii]